MISEVNMTHRKFLYFVLYGIVAALCLHLGFKYALPAALPFLAAFFIAASVQGAAGRFSSLTGIPKRFFSLLFGLLFFASAGIFVFFVLSRLWAELASIARNALAAREDIMGFTASLLRRAESFVLRFFPAAEGGAELLRARIELFTEEALLSLVSAISTRLPAFMGKIFSHVPKILFSLGVTLISCIYLCLDYEGICAGVRRFLSRRGLPLLARVPRASFLAAAGYLRALFVIFLLTSAVLAAGFMLLGVKYAWLFAAVAAFIDALPVFGSGAILLPYSAALLVCGDLPRGAGIALLWGAVTLLRQIIEPKVMSKSLGVHPLLNLAAVYAGASLFGWAGIVFMPVTVVILKNLFLSDERSRT